MILLRTTLYVEKQENNVLTIHGLPEAKLLYRTALRFEICKYE